MARRRIIAGNNETACRATGSLAAKVEGVMSEKIYDVPAQWASRAWVDQAR